MPPIKKETIAFENHREATAVFPPANAAAEEIINALELKAPKAVILIIGGAEGVDEKLKLRLIQLFSRGIARAAADAKALIIDGGTQSGVMAMMGQGVADRGFRSSLIGIAPIGRVNYPGNTNTDSANLTPLDVNHSHFVLVKGDAWGSELSTMFSLAEALMARAPGMVILAGGGPNTRNEVLQAVRRKLPLVVIAGSGGLADDVAAAWSEGRSSLPDDHTLTEIIEDSQIRLLFLSDSLKGVEGRILRDLLGRDEVLLEAWEKFADYDLNAMLQQKKFNRLQISVLMIGVIGTALTIVMGVFAPKDYGSEFPRFSFWWWIHKVLLIVPILLTVLITAASRFKHGNKWLLLRAGAEAIKREIYRYRTRSTYYRRQLSGPSPEQVLSQRLEEINLRTMRTEVSTSGLESYNKDKGLPPHMEASQGGDDGFSWLTPERYVEVRLGDQLNFLTRKAIMLGRQLVALQWSIWIIGGIGTFLAVLNQQVWIALTTAVVAALTSYLGNRRTEDTLTKYNEVKTDLANVRSWWRALSPEDQAAQNNVDALIDNTEAVLKSEMDDWVQLRPNVLSELRKGSSPSSEREETSEWVPSDKSKEL